MPIKDPKPGDYEQLALGLDLPEAEIESDGKETQEEIRARLLAAENAFKDRERPEWYGDYARLRQAGWAHPDAIYIAWAACPRPGRKPKTLDELAKTACGYTSARQIHKRRSKNPVLDEAVSLLQAEELFEGRADVIRALVESASEPSYRNKGDRELYFKLRGELSEQIDLRRRTITADEMAEAKKDIEDFEDGLLSDDGGEELERDE